MRRREHSAMVAISCDSNHRCKAPNGAEGQSPHASHPGSVDIECENSADEQYYRTFGQAKNRDREDFGGKEGL